MADLPSEEVTTHPLDGTEPEGPITNKDVLNDILNDGEVDPLTKFMTEKEAEEKAQKEKDEKVKKATEGMSNQSYPDRFPQPFSLIVSFRVAQFRP